MTPKPWYDKGLQFSCSRCGNCCTSHGEHSYLYVSRRDVTAIAAWLGQSEADFRAQHVEELDGWLTLKTGAACTFLQPDKSCGIYPVRPMQCRTWPFWKENLDERRWNETVCGICPGAGQGELHGREEIERSARENEEWLEE